jgi:micrococcal nuclease
MPGHLAAGRTFAGPVVYVGDGDSLCIATGRTPESWVEVRIADFYAPELRQPGGREAKRVLEGLAMGKHAVCRAQKRSYDRVVANCRIGGVSIGDLMRAQGVAEGGNGR